MRHIQFNANQHNINKMVEVQRQKINHLKMLNTIYKKKSYSVLKDEQEIDKERTLRINNQLLDKERKWRQTQSQINHQNSLLRNKLLQIYIPKQTDTAPILKTNQSLDSIHQDIKFGLNFPIHEQTQRSRTKISTQISQNPLNSKKIQVQKQINQANSKLYVRLSNIQSELMPKLKLRQHHKETNYFKEMILKSSPRKSMRMKKIVQKTTVQKQAKFFFPSTKSQRQRTISNLTINPQEPFIFY